MNNRRMAFILIAVWVTFHAVCLAPFLPRRSPFLNKVCPEGKNHGIRTGTNSDGSWWKTEVFAVGSKFQIHIQETNGDRKMFVADLHGQLQQAHYSPHDEPAYSVSPDDYDFREAKIEFDDALWEISRRRADFRWSP